MYVITGATGNTGRRIAEKLLAAGKAVTAISRQADHLEPLIRLGARPAVGSLEDAAFLTETFRGAKAVYVLIPPNYGAPDFRAFQAGVADSIVAALRSSRVPYVVALSSFGAHSPKTGVVAGLEDLEKKLATLPDTNVLNLRAGFFMQNFYGNIGIIKNMGINGGFPIEGDLEMPVVHTNDIADVAFQRLQALDFSGKGHTYVAGPRDMNLQEVTRVLGKVIGKPDLPWVTFTYDQARQGMIQGGLSESLADNYVQFAKAVNEREIFGDYQRKPEFSTPTSLEEFAREFAVVYEQSA